MLILSQLKCGVPFKSKRAGRLERFSNISVSCLLFWLDWLWFFLKVEKIFKGRLDLIPSPSVKILIMGRKICLRCIRQNIAGSCQQTFISPANFTAHYLNFHCRWCNGIQAIFLNLFYFAFFIFTNSKLREEKVSHIKKFITKLNKLRSNNWLKTNWVFHCKLHFLKCLDFCWYFTSYEFMRKIHICLIHLNDVVVPLQNNM